MAKELSVTFLEELLRLMFLKKTIVEKVAPHLKYQYLPSPEFKKIYKDITDYYGIHNAVPTFGVIYEINKEDDKLISVLNRIKNSDIVDPDPVLRQLEKYIRDVKFQLLFEQVVDIHEKGDHDRAILEMSRGSSEIVEFSIFKENNNFTRVFEDFNKMQLVKQTRQETHVNNEKIPFGILPCDILTQGGSDRKDTILWIMRSGVGKSTVLKWQGMYACRLGYRVLHIQLEGSQEEAFDKYTQVWSALSYYQAKTGNIEESEYNTLLQIASDMVTSEMDICIKSFEQFDEASMVDVRDAVVEYIKENGVPPDMLILDSIDLANPGDGAKYGVDNQSIKMKLQNCSRKFKNICNEFDMRGATATQTSDVNFQIWNDPDKVITRSDSMGDKNIANPYSFVFTGNQTLDEEKNKIMRVYADKIRHYSAANRVYPICTSFATGRFYDADMTNTMFGSIYNEQQ